MWTLAWWWMLAALPLPWLVRRVVRAEPLDRDAALRAPVAAEFADLAGLRAPHAAQRNILATNVAETSLTIPGVRFVIDSGLARMSR